MKTLLRSMMAICMLTAALAIAPAPASAQEEGQPVGFPAGMPPDMPAGLQEAILSSTTKPFEEGGGKYMTSAGDLRVELDAAGLEAGMDGLQWGIALQGIGRGTEIMAVSAPEISQKGGRLEYQRDLLTEWYRDTAFGVEQGFTINESPKGNGKLILHLDLSSNVEGRLNEDGRGISFAGRDGQTLRYDHLEAYDADGVELKARMIYEPGKVQILVNDRGAVYPITIDPLIYLEQKVIAQDGAPNDQLGYSVALSGDTALVGAFLDDVGANSDQGSAYVFVRSGTTWTQQAQLTASDGTYWDCFGASVALSGDTALVGAFLDDVGANPDQGSAYVFVRSGTTWTQQAQLTASYGAGADNFGFSVALSGDTALVGAVYDDVGTSWDQGSVYVFVRSGTTWSQQQQLTASDGAAIDHFGSSVALSGDTAVVGAEWDDVGASTNQGSAYVFVRSGTTWSVQAQLTATDGAIYDLFGYSVSLSGNTALIGAYGDDVSGNDDLGSAYVFVRSGTIWSQQAKLNASDGAAIDQFGISVALSGDTALVGAYNDDVGASVNQGSAYVFVRSGATWNQQTKLTASDGAINDNFGVSVSVSGDTALVGTSGDDVSGNGDQGSAYFQQAYHTDADLAVSASSGPGSLFSPGQTVLLTTSVLNYGPASASAVMMNVSLPAGLTYVSHSATYGTYTSSTHSWSVGTLALGVTATLTIQATLNPIPAQVLTFTPYLLSRDTNDSNNRASVSIGRTDLTPSVTLTPSLSFGNQRTGAASAPQTATLSNTGTGALTINSIYLSGIYAADFDIAGTSTCPISGGAVSAGSSCTIDITFAPVSTGSKSASIKVADNASGSPHSTTLGGTGVIPGLILTPSSLTFGSVIAGLTSTSQTISLTNYGTSTMNITSVNLIGMNPTDFSIGGSSTCPISGGIVSAGNSCSIDVIFNPAAAGSKSAVVQIISDASGSPHAAGLSGTGVAQVISLTADPISKNYGSLKVGSISVGQVFTISNSGNVNLNIGTLSLSGTNPTTFSMSADSCSSATVAPSASCTVSVAFAPQTSGALSATLDIPSNAPTSPNAIALTGLGMMEKAKNGGFNTYVGISKIPQYWAAANFAATDGKITTVKKEGTASVKISNTAAKTKTLTQTLNMSGNIGDVFGFSFWAKGVSIPVAGICQAQVLLYNGATLVTTKTVICKTGTYGFTQKLLNFTSPGTYTKIVIKLTYTKATGTIYFDGLSLLRAP